MITTTETEIGGYNETTAAALFAPSAVYMLGCQFASLVLDNILFGVLFMQVVSYFSHQPKDKWWTKAIVIWTTFMNVVVSCWYWAYISYLFVDNYGKWLAWLEVRWLAAMPTFDVVTVSVVQFFFAYRAFLLNKRNWYLLIVIGIFILTSTGAGVGVTVVFGMQTSLLGATESGPPLITWCVANTLADGLIAVSIIYGLLQNKSGWARTDKLIHRFIRLTFEAQLLPTVLALGYVIEWSITPSGLLGALFQALKSKVYVVGLLFSLNSRITLVPTENAADVYSISGTKPQVFGMNSRTIRFPAAQIQVDVETETYIQNEHGYEEMDKKTDSSVPYQNTSTAHLTLPHQNV